MIIIEISRRNRIHKYRHKNNVFNDVKIRIFIINLKVTQKNLFFKITLIYLSYLLFIKYTKLENKKIQLIIIY